MWNIVFIIIICIAIAVGCWYYFKPSKGTIIDDELTADKQYTIEAVIEYVRVTFNEVLKNNLHELNLSREEYEKRLKNKSKIRQALKMCTYGDKDSKDYIKDYIKDILITDYKITEDTIEHLIPFEDIQALSVKEKFDILLYILKKQYAKDAVIKLFDKYHLDRLREDGAYYITADEIADIYRKEKKVLSYEDKINILSQRIYEAYKGFSIIDELRDMNIDGVSCGVSGVTQSMFESMAIKEGIGLNYQSTWILYQGKSIHLRFLGFETEAELKRVCKNIYKYNSAGQLSESNGYKTNDMKDGSRIVVVRPPFADSWAFFVRKLDNLKSKAMEDLLIDKDKEIPIGIIKYILKAHKTVAITGGQGAGKSTFLMSMIKFVDKRHNIRTQEMMFELQLRKLYPDWNILGFRETQTITGQEGLDLQKKTDGALNILGEVAHAETANWMVQMRQVASLYNLFTHHAVTTKALIEWCRNAILKCGGFSNEFIAEQQVVEAINFDIHLSDPTTTGHRYVERITEIVPYEESYNMDYQEQEGLDEKMANFMNTMVQYFERNTNRKTFEERQIVKWENNAYKLVNTFSSATIETLKKKLTAEEFEEFEAFFKAWGVIDEF